MAVRTLIAALAALGALQHTAAQTFTYCNPLNTTCPSDEALGSTANFDMSQQANSAVWNMTAGPMTYGSSGAEFTITQKGQSPTIQSVFYIMFGTVSVVMQAAKGTGIISSIVLESDDLDEIDWEFMGGNTTHVETNFFGKGNTTTYNRAIYYPVDNPQDNFHNYTTHWTSDKLEWWIDGNLVRTLNYGDSVALNGKNYPQTPMTVRLGIWAGGDSSEPEGVREWAGGNTSYADAPFTMFVKSVNVTDFGTGKAYTYSDMTGSWTSIKSTPGNSTVLNAITRKTGINGFWSNLSPGARTGIIAGAIALGSILIAALLICCFVQARKGKKEKAIADAEYEKERAEFNQYRMDMMKGGFSQTSAKPTYTRASFGPGGRF